MRVGVLGIGRMGLPIAAALDAGAGAFEVVVFDTSASRLGAARDASLATAANAHALAASADVLVTALPGPAEVAAALADVLPHLSPGTLWLDLSSSDPAIADRLSLDAAGAGIAAVAAPMGGGPTAAASGALRFFVGGDDAAVTRAHPVLVALGGADAVQRIGASLGAAHTAKLLANLLWFGQVVAVTEALLLGVSLGLSPSLLRQALAHSAGGSVFIDQHLDALLAGDNLTTFGLDRCVEELDTLTRLATEQQVPFELSSLVARLHREALDRFGAIDGELLAARLLEERAGLSLGD